MVGALVAAVDGVRDDPGAPRWSDPADLHVTLAFLGEVPGARVAGLLGALGPVAAGSRAPDLQLTGAGTFGRRPRVLWSGVTGDVAALDELAGRVAAAARHAGVPVEDRPFVPHLTLGRWPGTGTAATTLPDRLRGPHGPVWRPAELVLWRSRPGTRYERLAGWPLGGPGSVAR